MSQTFPLCFPANSSLPAQQVRLLSCEVGGFPQLPPQGIVKAVKEKIIHNGVGRSGPGTKSGGPVGQPTGSLASGRMEMKHEPAGGGSRVY